MIFKTVLSSYFILDYLIFYADVYLKSEVYYTVCLNCSGKLFGQTLGELCVVYLDLKLANGVESRWLSIMQLHNVVDALFDEGWLQPGPTPPLLRAARKSSISSILPDSGPWQSTPPITCILSSSLYYTICLSLHQSIQHINPRFIL